MKAKDRALAPAGFARHRSKHLELLPLECPAIDPQSANAYLEQMHRLLERSRRSVSPRKDDYRIRFDH